MDERTRRVGDAIREVGAEWALLASPGAVAYATGHAVPIETGPSPFASGPTLALVTRDGTAALVCPNHDAGSPGRADSVHSYEGFGWETRADHATGYLDALAQARSALGVSGAVAVEPAHLPAAVADAVGGARRDLSQALDRARAVKTPDEVAALTRGRRDRLAGSGGRAARGGAGPRRARDLRRGARGDGDGSRRAPAAGGRLLDRPGAHRRHGGLAHRPPDRGRRPSPERPCAPRERLLGRQLRVLRRGRRGRRALRPALGGHVGGSGRGAGAAAAGTARVRRGSRPPRARGGARPVLPSPQRPLARHHGARVPPHRPVGNGAGRGGHGSDGGARGLRGRRTGVSGSSTCSTWGRSAPWRSPPSRWPWRPDPWWSPTPNAV